ncbi:MAG TPA: universal stress protein [Ktedonobacteraceae bacterium]
MFQRILVPLDGSERARQALPVAARIARDSGGSLLLLSVMHLPLNFTWQMETGLMQVDSRIAVHQEQEAELAALASSEELKGIKVTREVVEDLPAQAILEKAQSSQADLIVMCSHGRSGITHWALGSVAQKVARHSPIPVLILHAGWPMALPPHGIRPVRVMVALDGSLLAENALLPAARLSEILSTPLPGAVHLVRSLPFPTDFDCGQDDAFARAGQQAKQDAQTYLQSIQQQLASQTNVHITCSIASSLDTAETLISIAETGEGSGLAGITESSDIIALTTHGRSGLARWVMGSIPERILGTTRLPLLIVRPQLTSEFSTLQEHVAQATP